MYLSVDSSQFPEIEEVDIDDGMEMQVNARVTAIRKNESGGVSVDLEAEVVSLDIKEVDLKEALKRAGEKEGILVRPRIEPMP